MMPRLRELVLNEARAHAVFANGRLIDHRFAVSLLSEELPDPRYNRAYIIEPANLTPETLEEISRDFVSVRLPLRLDIFVPIPDEAQALLERRGFEVTEDYASVMALEDLPSSLRGNPEVEIREPGFERLNDFATVMLKGYDTPPDLVRMLASIFRRTIPRALEHRGAALYLAFLEDEPVGTLYLFSQGGIGGIYHLAVLQQFLKQGVATALMLKAIEDSRAAGNEILCLQTRVGPFQERFFERLGFKTVARRKRAMKES